MTETRRDGIHSSVLTTDFGVYCPTGHLGKVGGKWTKIVVAGVRCDAFPGGGEEMAGRIEGGSPRALAVDAGEGGEEAKKGEEENRKEHALA
eukprot:evm.model.NODE_19127_length_26910_cov_44.841881.3